MRRERWWVWLLVVLVITVHDCCTLWYTFMFSMQKESCTCRNDRNGPEDALIREVREELGITDFTPEFMGKYVFDSKRERELVYVNRTTYNGQVRPSSEELDGGRFWTIQEIHEAIGKGVLTPNFEMEFQQFFG